MTQQKFKQWQAYSRDEPIACVDRFFNAIGLLSETDRRSYIASTYDRADLARSLLKSAHRADAPLAGIPYTIQDLVDVSGLPTGCGAPFDQPFEGIIDCSSELSNALDTMGACLFAKTVPAEFGVDIRGRNPSHGTCAHPDSDVYVLGGGAGSTVRAVAEGLVPLGVGVDTSGGIRIPAAFQGCFGFRMGHNAYTHDGLFPIMPSVESIGWVTNTISTLKQTFRAFYPHAIKQQMEPKGFLIDDPCCHVSPEVKSSFLLLSRELDIHEDPQQHTRLNQAFQGAGNALQLLQARELYTIHQYWIDEYRDRYDTNLLRRIYRGMECSSAEVELSGQVQERIKRALTTFFERYDYLLMPVSSVSTPRQGDWNVDLESDLMQLIAPASLSALPALILPFICEDGMHGAAQLIINPRKVGIVPDILDQVAAYYED